MKLYVAGKWGDKARVRVVVRVLRDMGHTITHDWTDEDPATPYFQVPLNDIRAIEEADAVVMVLAEDLGYVGSWVELGAALAYGRPVYIIMGEWLHSQFSHADDPTEWRNVFLWHPLVHRWEDFPDQLAVARMANLHLTEEDSHAQGVRSV